MSSLNAQQIAALLQKQGVAKEKIPTMTAIALAESSGRPQAFNPNSQTSDRSYGLFQVNMHGGLGPARMKEFGLKNEKDLFNPETNVRAANQILNSQGLGAWSVYKSGQYRQFLPEAQKAVSSLGTTPITPIQATQQAGQQTTPTTSTNPNQQNTSGNTYNIHIDSDNLDQARTFLSDFLPKVIGQTVATKSGIDANKGLSDLWDAAFTNTNYA